MTYGEVRLRHSQWESEPDLAYHKFVGSLPRFVKVANMSVSITELKKAANSLAIAVSLLQKSKTAEPDNIDLHKALRDGCIQRFEFCVELSWKTSMKLLALQTQAPGPAVREMAQNSLISDVSTWLGFLQARIKTSHSYEEEVAIAVYSEIERFLPELDNLIRRLERLTV